MIDLCNLSSDDETFDNISSSDKSGPSSTVCDSPGQSSTHDIKYNTSNIKTFLREQPEKYVLVENRKVNQTKPAACWSRFALPAMKDENSCNTIIRNFAVCRSCYTTCSYTLGLTKSLNSHKCAPSTYSSSSFSIKSSWKSRVGQFSVGKKKMLTSTIATWICESIRPLSIVEDIGFLNVIQQCVNYNGDPLANININGIVPMRTTMTREINRQANEIRERLGIELQAIAQKGCLSISPDLRSDKFKQNSYIGLTAHFVDDDHGLHSIIFCCEPYNEIDKRVDSVRRAITAALSRFGLDVFMEKKTCVCDRGSNFIKALEDYEVAHCFPHRLNNILKRTFYCAGTAEKNEKKKKKSINKNQNDDQFSRIVFITNDDDPLMDYDDRDSSETLRSLSSIPERDHVNVLEKDLPLPANQLLATIARCKQLCCYVKRVNWNPLLQELKKPTIKQEVIVRWLSMSQLLESITPSYSALTNIASEKGTLHTLPSIDVASVATIARLFEPWKQVIERVQSTNTPSLHLVATSYWYLLESMMVTKEEISDKAARGIIFFKTRARQLLKVMCVIHELHWIATVLNPRTRMLKLAADGERCHAHGLVCSKIAETMETGRTNSNQLIQPAEVIIPSSPPQKKFKSYTTQFDDDVNCDQLNNDMTNAMQARRELDTYLQLDLTKCTYCQETNDNPLMFWKEQEFLLPNLAKLSKKIFTIPASSAAVERSFSATGYTISQRRTNINPSTVNDLMLVRSAALYLKS